MRRIDRIKLNFIRNWNFPGKERLSHRFKPSAQLKSRIQDGVTWLNKEDIAIYTCADSYIEWTILTTGTYEDEIGKLIRVSLNVGDTALDIGANIGLQSVRMSRAVGITGRVLAFEPVDYIHEKLKKNLSLNKIINVDLFPFALSDESASVELKIDKNAWNQGTFSLMNKQGNQTQRVVIQIADEVAAIKGLVQLSLVKIDVEGFEYQVLKGLKQTLEKFRPRIIFEYDHHYWKASGQSIIDCFYYLTTLGYILYQIDTASCERIHDPTIIIGGNLFCLPTPTSLNE